MSRKTRISLVVKDTHYDKLKQLADDNGISMSSVIQMAIAKYLQEK